MIQHTVAFRLGDGADAGAFWARVETLGDIGGVQHFTKLRQVSLKNEYTHGLSMYFDSQTEYDAYNNHPVHVAFVEEAWLPHVTDFIELDYMDV